MPPAMGRFDPLTGTYEHKPSGFMRLTVQGRIQDVEPYLRGGSVIRRLLRRQRPLPEVEHVIRVAETGEEFAVSREAFMASIALTNEEDSMNDTRFTVEFRGEPPANVKVGDEIEISGLVTVQRIGADLVDVSDGGRTAYLPGEITIELWANHLEIKRSA